MDRGTVERIQGSQEEKFGKMEMQQHQNIIKAFQFMPSIKQGMYLNKNYYSISFKHITDNSNITLLKKEKVN